MRFGFFKSKTFLVNTAIMLTVTVVLIWLIFKFLNLYTRHGQTYIVPDFSGKQIENIKDNSDNDIFDFITIDSVYDNSMPGGAVFSQDPAPGSEVKKYRTIYLTIVQSNPEQVELPNLGNTLRQARSQLQAYGFRVGKIEEVPSRYPGLLINVYYMGKIIKAGKKLPKGARIDLDVGNGIETVDSLFEGDNEDETLLNAF